jgi:thiol-disulfide isomerase/thioredoxin
MTPAKHFAWALLCSLLLDSAAMAADSITGLWNAKLDYGAIQVPFQFGIAQTATGVSGWFFNGDERVVSDSGQLNSGHLVLEFPTYGRRIDAQLDGSGTFTGSYGPAALGSTLRTYPFSAQRAGSEHTRAGKAPSIDGLWIVTADSQKAGEKSWRFIVHQTGAQIRAAILRVDGDTGALTGSWQDGRFVLSHFDGARPLLLEVTPAPNQAITVLLRNSNGSDVTLTGYRAADARARGIPDAADPTRHTGVKDPAQPFQFSFPNLNGQLVSNTDSRFRGKVVVVDIAGSWCPNCHDEAPFLETLYRKYHARGLEIVTLSFEEPEQYANPVRLRAFVKDFGLDYTVLLAGTLDELHAKVPQAVDLDAYPTTFFVGRDGLVKSVHAGFAAAATGSFNTQLKRDFTATIEKLLADKAPARQASARMPGNPQVAKSNLGVDTLL